MYQFIFDFLQDLDMYRPAAAVAAYLLSLVAVAGICAVAVFIIKPIITAISSRIIRRTKSRWDDIFYENRFFHRVSYAVIPITLALWTEGMPQYNGLFGKLAHIAGIAVLLLLFNSCIKSCEAIYNLYEVAKLRPIRGVLQSATVVIYVIAGIAFIAILAGKDITVLLGGIGAATAIVSLIFKDSILGFVAGIQLTANDMIRIGDWIEMPKYSADGTVIELSMTTVKVENFNKTITTIPAYTLVSDAFINWRGMERSGGRRIKRAIYIVVSGIRLCDDEMIERFRSIALIRDYIHEKQSETERYNREHGVDLSDPVNGRRLTNVGTFRAYMLAYIRLHPGIHHGMTTMVRQLDPDERGLPLEIYAFTNTTEWAAYENIQADIFDHLYAIAPEFGLEIYQKPSAGDFRIIKPLK